MQMCSRLLLVGSLLSCCSGEPLVRHPPVTVRAFAGGAVVLPCSFSVAANKDFPTVEWSKEDLRPDVVLLYRDGCETHEMKNPAFRYRTSLIAEELKNGNVSLRISNVQIADAGKYKCKRLWRKARLEITAVELVVAAVSEPKLSVTSAEGGGVTLQCEANCWLPEPEIDFLDDRGKEITADDPKRDEDARGCHTVRRRVTLQDAPSRVTCRVHQPTTNQTRDTELLLPGDGGKYRSLAIGIAVGGTFLLAAAAILAIFVWKRCCKSAGGQKLPVHSRISDTSKEVIEMLTVEVTHLKSKICEKDETIRRLQDDKSRLSAVVCQNDQPPTLRTPAAATNDCPPKSGDLPQIMAPKPRVARQISHLAPGLSIRRLRRRHSSPVLLNLAAFSSFSGPNAKLQRRQTIAFPSSGPSNNRFTHLADLPEESQMLIM